MLCNCFISFCFFFVLGLVWFGAWLVRKAPMASPAPPAGPANSGGGDQESNHLPSSSDSPVSPPLSETPPFARHRYLMSWFHFLCLQNFSVMFCLKLNFSGAVKHSDGTEGPVSSRLRHLPGRYLSTSQLPVATPPSPLNPRFASLTIDCIIFIFLHICMLFMYLPFLEGTRVVLKSIWDTVYL